MIKLNIWQWLLRHQPCNLCGQHRPEQAGLCTACRNDLPWQQHSCPRCALPLQENQLCAACIRKPPPFLHTFAPFTYRFPFDQLIPAIKYQQQTRHIRWIAELMAQKLPGDDEMPGCLIPVPISRQRLAERGFNQAHLLAAELSKRTGIPLRPELLSKIHDTPHQTGLDASTRRRNLKGSFRCHGSVPAHIALIDDVMTTASTARELSSLLKRYGAERIDIWVIARTPEKNFY